MNADDRRVVQCNVAEPTKVAAAGARAYFVCANRGNGHDRIMILVRSRGGRWVSKYEDIRRLTNFRVKTLPSGHPRYLDTRIVDYCVDQLVAELTEARQRVAGA